MIILIVLGDALLCRGQPLTEKNQLDNIKRAAQEIADLVDDYQLVLTHGNGS